MRNRRRGPDPFPVHRRRLTFERMEERRLLSWAPAAPDAISAAVASELASLAGTVGGYPVSIDRHDAPGQPIDASERAWLVIHGNASAPTTSYIDALADALHSASPGDQVLTLDWSTIAALAIGTTENKIIPVARWASTALTTYGFSGDLLNPIGHSFGAYVAAEMAERIPGGVNTIVGLDPAENWPFGYSPESPGEVDFAGFSAFSWVFSDAGGFYGSEVTPGSAHEAVAIENTDHSGPVELFANMLNGVGNADVLQYFPISRLLDHTPGPWAPNQYDHSGDPTGSGTFEAVITADAAGDTALSIEFVALEPNDPPTAEAGGTYYVDEGTTIQLDASGSTDPGGDIVSYLWDLDGDGLFGETGSDAARGDEVGVFPTFSAVGLDGPVSLTVSLRVVDDSLASDQDTATIWITEPLGPVDFLEMNDLDLSSGELWYSLETTYKGFLTILSLSSNGTVTLYDANANPVASGAPDRVDWQAGWGERYLFKVSGSGANVDLRLANLVSGAHGNVTVWGTDDEDVVQFDATASRLVTINAVPYLFTDAEATSVSFHALTASDTAILTGNEQNETAELWPDFGTFTGADYVVTLVGTGAVVVHGGGGFNVARLHDSNQADFFEAWPNLATFSGPTFSYVVDEVRNVRAYADGGGVDTAVLHDMPGAKDTFIGSPTQGELYDGASYYSYASDFEKLTATATAGGGFDDRVRLYDGVGHDGFDATPHDGTMKYGGSADHFVRAAGFKILVGYATGGGIDTANLQDSPNSRDIFIGKPDYGQLYDGATFFSGTFYESAVGFEQVTATATPGVGFNDQARLYDGVGHDVFDATPEEATLKFDGDPTTFVHATGFRSTIGYATSSGIDVANLQDSPDSKDTFIANSAWAKLYNSATFYEAVVGFEQTIATASAVALTSVGDTTSTAVSFPDKAKLYDGVGNDVFDAAPNEGTLKFNGNPNRFVQAAGFRSVINFAENGGIDTANLQDSPGSKDTFNGTPTYGNLYDGATFYLAALGSEEVNATATPGDGDVANLSGAADGIDSFEGNPSHPTYQSYAKLYGSEYSRRVMHFDEIYADAGSGVNDRAHLWDSQLDDTLEVAGDSARLYRTATPYLFEIARFDFVTAESTTQGDNDTVTDAGHLFDLDLQGWWENV